MSNIKALRLDQWGVKEARRHKPLEGKQIIGRGVFSAVFEGTRKNTVLKLTVDDIAYWSLNDIYVGVRHRHVPRVIANYREVGSAKINGRDYPIFLYEIERLERVNGEARRLAKLICNAESTSRQTLRGPGIFERPSADKVFATMAKDKALPRSVRNALCRLAEFAENVPGGDVDLHMGNFMQRANGDLVLSDPIANMSIWQEARHALGFRREVW